MYVDLENAVLVLHWKEEKLCTSYAVFNLVNLS